MHVRRASWNYRCLMDILNRGSKCKSRKSGFNMNILAKVGEKTEAERGI